MRMRCVPFSPRSRVGHIPPDDSELETTTSGDAVECFKPIGTGTVVHGLGVTTEVNNVALSYGQDDGMTHIQASLSIAWSRATNLSGLLAWYDRDEHSMPV
jgi:hypothetical protein